MIRSAHGTCRDCPAPVWWVRLSTGKRNPLNPDPDPGRGNVRIAGNEAVIGTVLGKDEAAEAREAGENLYLSHFATCPAADRFRRDRGRSGAQGVAHGARRADPGVPALPSLFDGVEGI